MVSAVFSATRILSVLAALALAVPGRNNNIGHFFAAAQDAVEADCGGTQASSGGAVASGTPAPTLSFRCLPSSLTSSTTSSTGTTASPTVPDTAGGATEGPTMADGGTVNEGERGIRVTPSPVPAEALPEATPSSAPTNSDGNTTDAAPGLTPHSSSWAIAASCGLLLAAALFVM